MNTVSLNTIIIALALVAAMIAVVAWVFMRQRQSRQLQERFGPEYGRTVKELGGRSKAELDLKERESRVARLNITPLTVSEAARFTEAWNNLQGRFIDNPKGALAEADHLVTELMQKRGYPMSDFEGRAADISVEYPSVVAAYRAARDIEVRDKRGEADTEELRQAIVHYRTLFDKLLEVEEPKVLHAPAAQIPVHS
jgi:hypothetical protein